MELPPPNLLGQQSAAQEGLPSLLGVQLALLSMHCGHALYDFRGSGGDCSGIEVGRRGHGRDGGDGRDSRSTVTAGVDGATHPAGRSKL